MAKMIFVNLPVRDLPASTAFYVALGGAVNPQFSGEQSSCLMFSEAIGVMLLTHDHYRQFTQRPIGDARRESQTLLALSADSRDAVDATLARASAVPIRIRCRITVSCMAAAWRIRTAMCGRSCGWIPPRTRRRRRAPDRGKTASGWLRAPFPYWLRDARPRRHAETGSNRMGFYQRHVVPRLVHLAMRHKQLLPFRERVVGAAEGRVLEIGVGSGMNFSQYGAAVTSVIGLEPSAELLRMARARAADAAAPITLLDASAEAIPLDSGSVDTVVTTWTLCSIPDARRALAEMRRVLKPGGALLFVEHGRAPEPGVARWQDRIDPLWSRIAGGCHINRKMDDLMVASGFRIEAMANPRLPGPRTHTFMYEGRARPR